ncbi:MAG TPA: glycosyltransferase [Actinomycetes bacterium]|nr:glycosyltransferase [Actinomycetes bacterium]
MRLLFFGTYDAAAHPRVAVLRDGLRAHGHGVHECDEPLGLSTAQRLGMLRNPAGLPLLGWRLARCWWALWRRSRPYRRGRSPGHAPDAVVVGYLGHFDVLLARRLFPHVPVVLDHLIGASDTATDRGVAGGRRQRLLRALDDAALAAADVVVVDTEEHRSALPEAARRRALVVDVGAPQEWYVAQEPDRAPGAPDDPLRVVFFGLFTPLQGAPVIGAALGELAHEPVEVTMVGSGQDLAATRRLAVANERVTWRDWVPADELPALVAGHDVCLGIFGSAAKATRVVPNKVFQGAAAGCAIVTSDTPPQRRVLDGAAVLVPPGEHRALAGALRDLAADRGRLADARAAARALAAERFTPDAVVRPLDARLRSLVPPEVPS